MIPLCWVVRRRTRGRRMPHRCIRHRCLGSPLHASRNPRRARIKVVQASAARHCQEDSTRSRSAMEPSDPRAVTAVRSSKKDFWPGARVSYPREQPDSRLADVCHTGQDIAPERRPENVGHATLIPDQLFSILDTARSREDCEGRGIHSGHPPRLPSCFKAGTMTTP